MARRATRGGSYGPAAFAMAAATAAVASVAAAGLAMGVLSFFVPPFRFDLEAAQAAQAARLGAAEATLDASLLLCGGAAPADLDIVRWNGSATCWNPAVLPDDVDIVNRLCANETLATGDLLVYDAADNCYLSVPPAAGPVQVCAGDAPEDGQVLRYDGGSACYHTVDTGVLLDAWLCAPPAPPGSVLAWNGSCLDAVPLADLDQGAAVVALEAGLANATLRLDGLDGRVIAAEGELGDAQADILLLDGRVSSAEGDLVVLEAGLGNTTQRLDDLIAGLDNLVVDSLTTQALTATGATALADVSADDVVATGVTADTVVANNVTATTVSTADIATVTLTAADAVAGTVAADVVTAEDVVASNVTTGTITAIDVAATGVAADTVAATDVTADTAVVTDVTADTVTVTTDVILWPGAFLRGASTADAGEVPGPVLIRGGTNAVDQDGGRIELVAGSGAVTSGGAAGGHVYVQAGDGRLDNGGGGIYVQTGVDQSSGQIANIDLNMRSSSWIPHTAATVMRDPLPYTRIANRYYVGTGIRGWPSNGTTFQTALLTPPYTSHIGFTIEYDFSISLQKWPNPPNSFGALGTALCRRRGVWNTLNTVGFTLSTIESTDYNPTGITFSLAIVRVGTGTSFQLRLDTSLTDTGVYGVYVSGYYARTPHIYVS